MLCVWASWLHNVKLVHSKLWVVLVLKWAGGYSEYCITNFDQLFQGFSFHLGIAFCNHSHNPNIVTAEPHMNSDGVWNLRVDHFNTVGA